MAQALQIAICEDVKDDAQRLLACICAASPASRCDVFERGEDLLRAFAPCRYDLIFLDIYLDALSGVETAQAIRRQDEGVVLAFTTGSEEHTREGYRLRALKYILKPVDPGEVADALALAEMKRRARGTFTFLTGGRRMDLPHDTILFFELRDRTVYVHTTAETLRASQTERMDAIEARVPCPPFLRSHHSFLVNLRHVQGVDRDFIMRGGARAYIRRSDVRKCADAYKAWLLYELGKED